MNFKEVVPARVLLPEKSKTQSLNFDEHVELRDLLDQTQFPVKISVAICNEYDEKYKTNIQGKLERYPRELLRRLTPLLNSKRDLIEKATNSDFTDPIGTRNFCRSLGVINNYLCIFDFKLADFPDRQSTDPLDKEIISFVTFGENIIHASLEKMESAIEKNIDCHDAEDIFRIVKMLLRFTTKDETKKDCFDFMQRNVERAFRNIVISFGKKTFFDSIFATGILDTFIKKGSKSQIDSAKEVTIKMLKDDDPAINFAAITEIVGYWMDNPETPLIKEIAREGFNVDIEKEALPDPKSIVHWRIITSTVPELFFKNLYSIQSLEKERGGIAQVLYREFGIIHFADYPREMLIDQYDDYIELQENSELKNNLPYGVVINPQDDLYGTFVDEKEVYEKLYDQVKGKAKIKIYEIDGERELVKVFVKSRQNYGQISLAIIGAHGVNKRLEFGYGKNGSINSKHLDSKITESIGQAFVGKPIIILNSCRGGRLGQKISERCNAIVLSPNQDIARINKLAVEFQPNGKVKTIDLNYEGLKRKNIIEPNVFVSGKKLDAIPILL
jgi:hypothetical protein